MNTLPPLPYGAGSFKDARSLQYFNRQWVPYRKGLGKKPKDWGLMFTRQAQWLCQYDYWSAKEIIDQSIRNGWRGLFETRNSKRLPTLQPAPRGEAYKRLPPRREVSDREFQHIREIVKREIEKLKENIHDPANPAQN